MIYIHIGYGIIAQHGIVGRTHQTFQQQYDKSRAVSADFAVDQVGAFVFGEKFQAVGNFFSI
jgi:hypothetical protein